ncbi:MAG: winged helix-turn-helix transcriptional regulator [Acidobacteriota bacterium]|nr:winged helix-turn-helix transcriptional regulator [Acidobacteriota bacterium]
MKNADYRALADFRYQIRCFLNLSEQAARAAGLEPQHHQILLAIKGAPAGQDPTVSYLAERLHLQHHSLVELLDRLEARRLARRVRSSADRRVVLVRITRRGERILRDLTLHHRNLLRTAGPALVGALRQAIAPVPEARGRPALVPGRRRKAGLP